MNKALDNDSDQLIKKRYSKFEEIAALPRQVSYTGMTLKKAHSLLNGLSIF